MRLFKKRNKKTSCCTMQIEEVKEEKKQNTKTNCCDVDIVEEKEINSDATTNCSK